MNKFEKLEEYSDDELIMLAYYEPKDWQIEAVQYAKDLLIERGYSQASAKKRLEVILRENDLLWKKELEIRKNESYTIFDLVLTGLFWFRAILQDWDLARSGYVKMRKQRLFAIGLGMLAYLLLFSYLLADYDNDEQERINEINRMAKADSIALNKIDWTGVYVFNDSSANNQVIWILSVKKTDAKHKAKLTFKTANEQIHAYCTGIIEPNRLEIFPDSTFVVLRNQRISYNDMLFSLTRDNHEVYTNWNKLSPYYHSANNGYGLFKRKTSAPDKQEYERRAPI